MCVSADAEAAARVSSVLSVSVKEHCEFKTLKEDIQFTSQGILFVYSIFNIFIATIQALYKQEQKYW